MQTAVGKPGKGVLEEYLMKVLHVDALADYWQLKGQGDQVCGTIQRGETGFLEQTCRGIVTIVVLLQ